MLLGAGDFTPKADASPWSHRESKQANGSFQKAGEVRRKMARGLIRTAWFMCTSDGRGCFLEMVVREGLGTMVEQSISCNTQVSITLRATQRAHWTYRWRTSFQSLSWLLGQPMPQWLNLTPSILCSRESQFKSSVKFGSPTYVVRSAPGSRPLTTDQGSHFNINYMCTRGLRSKSSLANVIEWSWAW